jgi:hypothetical protein
MQATTPQESIQFDLDHATLTIPKDQLLKQWLAAQLVVSQKAPVVATVSAIEMMKRRDYETYLIVKASTPLSLGQPWPEQGGIYAGTIRGENGQPDYHLIHATADHELTKIKWQAAIDAAKKSINGFDDWSLPDRREARLLTINSPDSFDKDGWYWTSTQYADFPGYAWMQYFNHGNQDHYRKSLEYRARAVRRVLIIQ